MSFVIRAAKPDDLQPIYEMAKLTGGGFTNLPADRTSLESKIVRSTEAFARTEDSLQDELFVLVLENTETREIRGTCQLLTRVGQKWPFYSYRLSTLTQHSSELGQTFRAEILSLVTDLEGSCEVGGLFLHPGERAGGLGLLLARSRYLFIAMHRARFTDRIIAELRGVIDEAGDSPFWDSIAGRFFGMSFDEADTFNALRGNQFIADLMPKHPVYVAMLSDAARHVLGRPNVSGRAAMRMLENEGFGYENYVDIFDGGPTMTARTNQVHTIRNSRDAVLGGTTDGGTLSLVATGRLADFRCAYGHVGDEGDTIALDAKAVGLLGVQSGNAVRWIAR
ncbi:arginine N-succinyltransferase [Blastomonas aquatica]|uniref:Arginine N-succinyltransferase n=1 Tax=Blastomonas aquatica TaxID=1510276 RepID=A0ABQ1JRV3_9SPHN|nr:arginine N-succinyltransferase [Blastomonas aquatica]GGB73396.1 arginine N-succinyltransferase [Blastomonas aquatica]